jgi:hypothetical protein
LLAAGAAQAAKAPKVDICHFDAEEGIFKPISLNGNAVANHVENHGDQFPNVDPGNGGIVLDEDCLGAMTPPPYVFARAYIDVNKNQSYDGDTDIDIAYVEDENNNGVLDIGDQVVFSQYPLNFDPCPAGDCSAGVGNYADLTHPVKNITDTRPTGIELNVDDPEVGSLISFNNAETVQWISNGTRTQPACSLIDNHRTNNIGFDGIQQSIPQGCYGAPVTDVVTAQQPNGRGYFLEIEMYPDIL